MVKSEVNRMNHNKNKKILPADFIINEKVGLVLAEFSKPSWVKFVTGYARIGGSVAFAIFLNFVPTKSNRKPKTYHSKYNTNGQDSNNQLWRTDTNLKFIEKRKNY